MQVDLGCCADSLLMPDSVERYCAINRPSNFRIRAASAIDVGAELAEARHTDVLIVNIE